MFGKKNAPRGLTYIACGTRLKGELHFCDDALISGEVSGNISADAKVSVEHEGKILGQLQCQEFRLSGYFNGKLQCDKLVITKEGRLEGEVICNTMEVFNGGQFIGTRIPNQPRNESGQRQTLAQDSQETEQVEPVTA
jgi:cytoskeletal protein CcmA (bactofilin family)